MKELLDKLSSYNIFNYLFPGILFAVLGEQLTTYSLLLDSIVIGVFVYYFYGLVISRIGSLFLEPLLKRIHFLQIAPYADFLDASKIDSKIELLSEANNMYRTLSSVFICLLFLLLFDFMQKTYPDFSKYSSMITILLLVLLFVFSYRKQTDYIRERITRAIQPENSEEVDDA